MVHSSTVAVATTVLVIERLRILRELLTDLLSSEDWVEATSAAKNLPEAREFLQIATPDVIVAGVPLAGGCSIEWLKELKQEHPGIGVVFLSLVDSVDLALSSINAGVDGYLAMDSSCVALVDAVRSVAAGDRVYDASISPILQRISSPQIPIPSAVQRECASGLSLREQEIVDLVAQGYTNQEIAQRLYVSINTVKTHLRRIYQRLGISSRRELIVARRAA